MTQRDLSIAGGTSSSAPNLDQLFAGDAPVITEPKIIATYASAVIPQWTPMTMDATTTKYKPATKGDPVTAITVYAIDARTGDVRQSMYTGGYFNTDLIAWPVAFDTELSKMAAVVGSDIHLRSITA